MRKYVGGARLAPVVSLVAATAIGLTTEAQASGFQLKEQSAEGLGNAFAGATAKAQDLSTIFFNPAGMTALSGHQGQLVTSYIIPRAEFKLESKSLDLPGTPLDGGFLRGEGNQGDAIDDALVPAAYAMYDASEDLKFGLAVNVPFGLVTDYDDNWAGRYHALKSNLETIAVQPSAAYRINDWLSVGGGPVFQYAKAELTKALDIGSVLANAALAPPTAVGNPAFDAKTKVTGDDFSVGYTLGVMFQPLETTRVGLSYRSRITHDLEGDIEFDGVAAPLSANPAFSNGKAEAKLKLPATASMGVYHEINDQLALMGEVAWTEWSVFKELSVYRKGATTPSSQTIENWDDTWFFSAGATYKADRQAEAAGRCRLRPKPRAQRHPYTACTRCRPHLACCGCRLRVHAGLGGEPRLHAHLGRRRGHRSPQRGAEPPSGAQCAWLL